MEASTEVSGSVGADVPQHTSGSDKEINCSSESLPVKHKRRRRRKHRRKLKPYYSMTAEERKEMDTADEAKQEAILAARASAPLNTTQFIMNDRGIGTPVSLSRVSRMYSLEDSLSGEEDSPDDDIFYQHRDKLLVEEFESLYREIVNEQRQRLSKEELVGECEKLERNMNLIRDQNEKEVSQLNNELDELRAQLDTLQKENEDLKRSQEQI